MNFAVIPARGGSARIPRKNILDFFGSPMIAYTIEAARKSNLFDAVIVSTDDDQIGDTAAAFGAKVLMRPAALGHNSVTVSDVVVHVLRQINNEPDSNDSVCMLMANCPLRTADDIVRQYIEFIKAPSAMISVVPYQGVYPEWAMTIDSTGMGSWVYSENLGVSQALAKAYCPTGATWWSKVSTLMESGTFYSSEFRGFPTDPIRGWDIDDFEDLRIARILVQGLQIETEQWPLSLPPR